MKHLSFLLLTLAFGVSSGFAQNMRGHILMTSKLTGPQQVPQVNSQGMGAATFMLNSTRDTMCIAVTVAGLNDSITAIGIHKGSPVQIGPLVVDLTPFVVGNQVATTLTSATWSAAFVTNMLQNLYYITVKTVAFPNGEIRGTILRETNSPFTVRLDGLQQTPANSHPGLGLGLFNLARDNKKLSFKIQMRDLSSTVTTAVLHMGSPGFNGPIVMDLTPFVNMSLLEGIVDPTPFLDQLKSGNLYINVSTVDMPAGELRSQLKPDSSLVFDVRMNGESLVPPVPTNGTAIGLIRLNPSFDTLHYEVLLRNFSAQTIVQGSVHFHYGEIGEAGPVVYDFNDSTGHYFSGTLAAPDLSDEFITALLRGRVYMDIHTNIFPDGQVRGQVNKQLREGYVFMMNGPQVTPPVATPAYGSGFASMDGDSTNVYFVAVYGDLSGPAHSAHLHQGVFGTPGAVIRDLDSLMTSLYSLEGYWTNQIDSSEAFTQATALKFIRDSIYIDIHTFLHPTGEIRGQVLRTNLCELLSGEPLGFAENQTLPIGTFELFPNPANGGTTMVFTAFDNGDATIRITDLLGRRIIEQTLTAQPGSNAFNVNLNVLASGAYVVHLQVGQQNMSKRLTKF